MRGTFRSRRNRLLAATVASQSIEFYDFVVYGTAASLVFSSQFFSDSNKTAALLASFATFAAGFVARPLGAVLFGQIGDKWGRKPALIGAMMSMAIASTLIGLLPTYAAVGILAPVLLVVLRCVQGIAVGGQWGGATLLAFEFAPKNKRGLYASIPQLGTALGIVVATLTFLLIHENMNESSFTGWGWRIAFLVSIIMFPLAFYIHRFIEETYSPSEATSVVAETQPQEKSSLARVLSHPRHLLLVTGTFLVPTVLFYIVVTGLLGYGTEEAGVSKGTLLTASMLSVIGFALGTIGFAALSDRVGRPRVYGGAVIVAGLWSFAIFPMVDTGNFWLILLAMLVALIAVGGMFGPGVAMLSEMFPPSMRYVGASLGYQLANILGAGFAPMIMVALLAATGTSVSVSVYMAVAALISIVSLVLLHRSPARDATTTSPVAA